MAIYILGALIIILPLLLIAWFAFSRVQTKLEWFLRFLIVGSAVLICYKIGTWSMSSYYIRFIIVALFFGSTLYSFRTIRNQLWHIPQEQRLRTGASSVLSVLAIVLSLLTLSGSDYSHSLKTSLKFPFAQGKYYVIQGGSNIMTNPFHGMSLSGKYAIDIVKMNKFGNRAATIFPHELTQYNIFGEKIYCPCNGRVATTFNNFQDNMPTYVNREHPAGNHIVIECGEVKVLLAHLKEGSIKVKLGDNVIEGQLVAEVGNSGYTDEPHLHIQANRYDGSPVAIMFNKEFLSINDIYVVK